MLFAEFIFRRMAVPNSLGKVPIRVIDGGDRIQLVANIGESDTVHWEFSRADAISLGVELVALKGSAPGPSTMKPAD